MSALAIGLGLNACGTVQPVIGPPRAPVRIRLRHLADNMLSLEAEPRAVSLTIADTGLYDGTYTLTPTAIAAGPVPLVSPVLSGGTMPGDLVTATPALWALEASASMPGISCKWQLDVAGDGNFTDIPDATGRTLELTAGFEGGVLRLLEKAGDVSVVSAPFGVGATLALALTEEVELELTASMTSLVALSLSGTGMWDGDHMLAPANLAAGPVSLVPPAISTPSGAGDTLRAGAGLWAHAGSAVPVIDRQWQVDRQGAGTFENLPDENGTTLLLDAGFAGTRIRVVETARQNENARQTASAALSI